MSFEDRCDTMADEMIFNADLLAGSARIGVWKPASETAYRLLLNIVDLAGALRRYLEDPDPNKIN